jgi:Flp pilus assembly protein TadG
MRFKSKMRLAPNAFRAGLNAPITGLRNEESGSSLVEYALIFALFITMLLGIADFSRALYAYHFVSSQAREATRYAMVRGCTPVIPTVCPAAATSTDVQTFARNVPLGIDSTKVTATTTWTPDHKAGSVVQVEVDYTFNFLFPFVSTSTLNMKSTSQMVISQ